MSTKQLRRSFLTVFLLFVLLNIFPGISIAQTWVPLGAEGFSEGESFTQSIAFIGETPYVAYMDRTNGDKATVMKFNGEGWEVVGTPGFSTGFMTNVIDIAVENGTPYVSYRDYSANYRASVMKYNSTSSAWEVLGQQGFSASTHDAYQCLAVYNDTPYLATRGTDAKATPYKFDGSDWAPLGTDGLSAGTAFYPTVKFDKNGMYWIKATNREKTLTRTFQINR